MQRPNPVRDFDWPHEKSAPFRASVFEIWGEFLSKLRGLPIARSWKGRDFARELDLRVPDEPDAPAQLTDLLRKLVFDNSMYPGHPGFMAYITGAGTIAGAAADLIAAAINQNAGAYRLAPAATEIEQFTTRWFAREVFGMPSTAGGLFVSGGAMANFVALKAARDKTMGYDVRANGVGQPGKVAWYASAECHAVIDRAADMLGLGASTVRKVPLVASGQLDEAALLEMITRDVAAGVKPAVVIATAGTVATGAIDPIAGIHALCERFGMWLHIDGAYGAVAILAPELRPLFEGIEHADSIAFDPHKWLYTPHSGGCVVVRDLQCLADSFAVHATYVHEDKERTGHGLDQSMLGPQFSRGFQALKVYLSLRAHGRAAYARRIFHDVQLARWLAHQVDDHPELERCSDVTLSICCFRYVPLDAATIPDRESYLDKLNERLMTAVQLSGKVYCSNALYRGRFVLRACIVNFRTEAEDIDNLVETAVALGRSLDRELRPPA